MLFGRLSGPFRVFYEIKWVSRVKCSITEPYKMLQLCLPSIMQPSHGLETAPGKNLCLNATFSSA